MKAIGYKQPGSLERNESLVDIEIPKPIAVGRDLLVEVKAISINPVDVKVRQNALPDGSDWKVLGWDAAGIVVASGPDAMLFKPGDEVFYAGSIKRPGTNSQFHLVDERIVGVKPRTLDWAEAAALPLTSITAWEMLFQRLDVVRAVPGAANAILIVGGAGGVGSIATQLARAVTDLTVITTASRSETKAWAIKMGAHHVIDHGKPLAAEIRALGLGAPAFVFSTTQTDRHAAQIAELIAPQGRFGLIDDLADANLFKLKSISIHWELMFTRPSFGTADMSAQGQLLNEVSRLVDAGRLRTTLTERMTPIDAATLRRAHALIETGRSRGKVVLEGLTTAA